MDDPGIVRVVCGYDMVETTLQLKTEKDVTKLPERGGSGKWLYKDKRC